MNQEMFKTLLERYLTGEATLGERELFFKSMDEPAYKALLEERIMQDLQAHVYNEQDIPEIEKRLQRNLLQFIQEKKEVTPLRALNDNKGLKTKFLSRIAAAAAILILLGTGFYFLFFHPSNEAASNKNLVYQNSTSNGIMPGSNKAVLTLSNGQQVILDSIRNGQLTMQGSSKVVKTDSGMIAYRQQPMSPYVHKGQLSTIQYNTLSTPRGGQYRLVLSDGTKVWLNAASSIHYPVAFTGKTREVEITGEAYFEVAGKPDMPFIVKNGNMIVKVLGTHFDVNTYNDENEIKVTLLEGSVRITDSGRQSAVIIPGEQIVMSKNGQKALQIIKDADVSEAVAWKNGLFQFDGNDIHEVMRQIARWYNVEVEYSGMISQQFYGNIPRSASIKQVLRMLETTEGVKFNIEAKKVIVLPY